MSDDRDAHWVDPYEQACDRLMADGLWPPIVGFGVGGPTGEGGKEFARIQHYVDLSTEVVGQIEKAMGTLPYELEKVTRRGNWMIGADGRVIGGPSRRGDAQPSS
jgi:hypothetical protein